MVGILSVAGVGFGIPAVSYNRVKDSYNEQVTDNVSDRASPVRPREVALVTVDHQKDSMDFDTERVSVIARAECKEICQKLLLSGEVAAVNISLSNGRHSVTATYRLENNELCNSSPFSYGAEIPNSVMAAALKGKCIVADPWRTLPNAVTVVLATDADSDKLKYVTIKQGTDVLFKSTAIKMKAAEVPFLVVPPDSIVLRDVYFGTWFDKKNQDDVLATLLKSKLAFSLAVPSEYADTRGRDNLRDMLALKSEAPFPYYFDGYAAHFCLRTTDTPDTAPEKPEMVETFTKVLMDRRLSLSGSGRCADLYEAILRKNLSVAVDYYVRFQAVSPDVIVRHRLLKNAQKTILSASDADLQSQADAIFNLVTEHAPDAFVSLWPRLGTLGNNDPSRFLLGKAALNNSASTEAIVGICNADRKWVSSFLPELEETLSKLDIFTANIKSEPKISLINGAAALSRFGDEAASERLIGRLPRDLQDKARAEVGKIVNDGGELPCSRYLN